jgi:putative endonuclease
MALSVPAVSLSNPSKGLSECVEGPVRRSVNFNPSLFGFHELIMPSHFYILRLQSGALYIGATKDLEKRYERHLDGTGGGTTSTDPPVALVYSEEHESFSYSEEHESFSNARKREAQVKRWTRAKKEALVAGDMEKLYQLSKSRENKTKKSG